MRSSAGNLKRVSLELGGKSPNVFFDDAPGDRVDGAVSGIFYNMGQDCSAGSRLFVQRGVYDEILSGVVDGAGRLRVGPGNGRVDRHRPARLAATRPTACSAT